MKRKKFAIIGGFVIILLAAIVIFMPRHAKDGATDDFYTVKPMDLSEKVDATGTVLALDKKDLYADYEGTVEQIKVKAGDTVKKGAILMSISSPTLKAQWQDAENSLKQAQLNLAQARAELATQVVVDAIQDKNGIQTSPTGVTTQLSRLDTVTQLQGSYNKVDLYNQQVKQAKEKLDTLKVKNDGYYMSDYEKLFIRAPFDGQVAWVNVKPGDKVTPQTLVTTEMKPDALGVEAQIDENDISMVQTGQKVLVTGNDARQSVNTGSISEISKLGQEAGGVVNFPVRIKLAGNYHGLQPGMSVDATVLTAERPQVMAIPAGSVTTKNGRDLVRVRHNGQITSVAVELGIKQGKYWEVKSGLKLGDQVAVPKPPLMSKQPAASSANRRPGMFGG